MFNTLKRAVINSLFICIILQLPFIPALSQDKLSEAYKAFRECNYAAAVSRYSDILIDDSSSQLDKASASRKLAYMSWHIRQDIEEARRYVYESLNFNDDIKLYLELADYEKEACNFKKALKLCELSGKGYGKTMADQDAIDLTEAAIVLAEASDRVEKGLQVNELPLLEALGKLVSINSISPGNLDVCEIQLGLALLLNEGEPAYQAWRGYYRIPPGQKATGMLEDTEKNLKDVLSAWDEGNLPDEKLKSLIVELANSRFYHYSYLLAKANNLNLDTSPAIKDILLYYEFCRNVDSLSNTYHRNIALNGLRKDMREDFYDSLESFEMDLWASLSRKGDHKMKFRQSRFEDELYRRFGTVFKKVKPYYTSMGKTGLFFFAHTVFDDHVKVEQYAYSADVHYVSLDFMYANSYDGWFLNNSTGLLGGWSSSSMIVRMRRAYSDKPLIMWNRITDPELKAKWLEEIETLTKTDRKNSEISPVAYFPGTISRMQFKVCNELLGSLQIADESETAKRMAFISEFESLLVQASIYCHEGRHIIDNRHRLIFEPICRNYEFRAKCSEIIFSENPYFTLAFSPVYMRNLNSKSKHSWGSRKAMENLAEWMNLNKNQIENFNAGQAALTQLDLLSNAQIISAFQSMDPLFGKRIEKLKNDK